MKQTKLVNNKVVRMLLLAVLALFALVSLYKGCCNAIELSQDFQWDAAKAFSMKMNPYIMSLHPGEGLDTKGLKEFYDLFEAANAPQKMEANQFPSLLMLLLPFTVFDPLAARYLWLACNLLFTAGIILLLRKTFLSKLDNYYFVVLMLLMLAGTPYRNQLGVGQHTLFSFFFFLLAVYLGEKEGYIPKILEVICLTICCFKYTLTAPLLLYYIYRKRIAPVAATAVIHVGLTAVSAMWLNASFTDMIAEPLKVAGKLASEGGLDFGALFSGSAFAFVLAGLVGIGLLIVCIMLPKGNDGLVISLLILWSLIMTYHRTYDFFVLAACAGMFTDDYQTEKSQNMGIMFYEVLLVLVFFVLRVFSENTASRIAIGTIYYAFTILVSIMAIEIIQKNKKQDIGVTNE